MPKADSRTLLHQRGDVLEQKVITERKSLRLDLEPLSHCFVFKTFNKVLAITKCEKNCGFTSESLLKFNINDTKYFFN